MTYSLTLKQEKNTLRIALGTLEPLIAALQRGLAEGDYYFDGIAEGESLEDYVSELFQMFHADVAYIPEPEVLGFAYDEDLSQLSYTSPEPRVLLDILASFTTGEFRAVLWHEDDCMVGIWSIINGVASFGEAAPIMVDELKQLIAERDELKKQLDSL